MRLTIDGSAYRVDLRPGSGHSEKFQKSLSQTRMELMGVCMLRANRRLNTEKAVRELSEGREKGTENRP